MRRVVITHALRTPIGKFLGTLKDHTSVELGRIVTKAILDRSGLAPDAIQEVCFGNARQAGAGPNPGRQISVKSEIPHSTTASTINMACASGIKAIAMIAEHIRSGEIEVGIAGGTESMSRLPYLLPRARDGYRLGEAPIVDAMYQDGFQCPLADQLMGATAENLADEFAITRDEQDRYAVETQQRCETARKGGAFAAEVVPVELRRREGAVAFATDEHARDGANLASMAKLPAVFKENGTVHAGNSSGITDGAAALLLMSEEKCRSLGLEALAYVDGWAEAGVEPKRMGIGPVPATKKLTDRLGIGLEDFDLIELNEAFAAQVLACLRQWRCDTSRINVNGGAIALGHPIGATGARIVVTLLHAMASRRARRGLATLCVSGGMGMSMAFSRPN